MTFHVRYFEQHDAVETCEEKIPHLFELEV